MPVTASMWEAVSHPSAVAALPDFLPLAKAQAPSILPSLQHRRTPFGRWRCPRTQQALRRWPIYNNWWRKPTGRGRVKRNVSEYNLVRPNRRRRGHFDGYHAERSTIVRHHLESDLRLRPIRWWRTGLPCPYRWGSAGYTGTDDEVYIGGHFTGLPEAKLERVQIASFLTVSGTPTGWNPGATDPTVYGQLALPGPLSARTRGAGALHRWRLHPCRRCSPTKLRPLHLLAGNRLPATRTRGIAAVHRLAWVRLERARIEPVQWEGVIAGAMLLTEAECKVLGAPAAIRYADSGGAHNPGKHSRLPDNQLLINSQAVYRPSLVENSRVTMSAACAADRRGSDGRRCQSRAMPPRSWITSPLPCIEHRKRH
jgi:hypothetical protein